jgi:putative exosortase-associated protein (TIGR04073 family)
MWAAVLAVACVVSGCSGPEKKLGRGVRNVTEFMRMGEVRRSMEQTAIYESGDVAYTKGLFAGLNKSLARTVVGAFEVLTFPLPGYEPYLKPGNALFPDMTVDPVYPDSYKPRLWSEPMFQPDGMIGFGGGDIAPWLPGSRFRVFDY